MIYTVIYTVCQSRENTYVRACISCTMSVWRWHALNGGHRDNSNGHLCTNPHSTLLYSNNFSLKNNAGTVILQHLYNCMYIEGVGRRGGILIGPRRPAKAALVRNYLEVYWPRAGGLSAVNAIGTQLRDPINSGLTR